MKKAYLKVNPYLLLGLSFALLAAILDGLVSLSMMDAIDFAVAKDATAFKEESIKLMLLALALLPANVLLAYGRGIYKRKSMLSLKNYYMNRLFRKNINEFQGENLGTYVSAMTNDMNTLETNWIDGIYQVGVGLINLTVGILVIASVSPIALGLGLGVAFFTFIISSLFSGPLKKHQEQRSHLFEGYTSYIKEFLSAFQIIKSNNLETKVEVDFQHRSQSIQQKGYIIDRIFTYVSSLQNLTNNLAFFGLFAAMAYLSITGEISLGSVILIVNNLHKLMNPIAGFGEWIPKIMSSGKLIQKMEGTLKNKVEVEETLAFEGFNHEIEFKDVTFSYEDQRVLSDVSLKLKKGGKYLVIGPSGGGKSTLLRLLRKYHRPQGGDILVDGVSLSDLTKTSYFNQISNIEQQVFLFEDTLRNNLTLYQEYSDDTIFRALDQAGLTSFVRSLPQGLDTIIVDNGKNVSGGEKSRIAIARGLLRKADLIFIDEAFANLDEKIAKEIESTLLNLSDLTVVNVSHVVFKDTKNRYDDILLVKNQGVSSYK